MSLHSAWAWLTAACATTSCSSGKVAGLIFYAIFAFYWASQVVSNVILCTLAGGVFGGWYYYGPRMNDGTGLPKNATGKAFGRATTLSLGSIAFGSLIVTILEILQTLFQALQNYQAQQGDTVGMILACCVSYVLHCWLTPGDLLRVVHPLDRRVVQQVYAPRTQS